MRSDLPVGTVTFLFTDVEGSTKLLHELGEEAYAEALAEHRRVIREVCTSDGGVEVDTQGDAFFFAFPTAPGALAAAAAFTDALSGGQVQVRVGLHTGTPLLTEEGYVGDDVHLGARIAAAAHGGQVVCSAATADLVLLELRDLGEHRLKDIAEPVSIFQLGDGSFPPLKTISNTNLPRPASSFLGREAELAEVLSRVQAGARLVSFTGPGGTGKTRLALEAAASLVGEYKAGVFWVGLASLRDPALVTETISQTLGAKDGLASHIGDREMLLLLDNLEQVIEAAPGLSALLHACPNLTLLVTSRELLRIQGEVEYAVPPLASQEAVDLFCARSGLEPSEDISELCARLDSLPLAVELAAARTKALTPSQITERLSSRLDLLKGGRDADPRQQTLRATIEWSYELLAPEEQRLFANLSVFVGGCTLEAAEEVCDADLDTLQSLVEKSLLRFTPVETGGRYWMLETVREYADETVRRDGEVEPLYAVFTEFFAGLGRRATIEFPEAQRQWGDRLELERDNFRTAMAWSLSNHCDAWSHELAVAYGILCAQRGPLAEGRSRLDDALRGATQASPAHRQRTLRSASILAERQGDIEAARAFGTDCVELARTTGDPDEIGPALLSLGVVECDAGYFDRAEELQREAVTVFATSGRQRQLREALGLLGYTLIARGNNIEARRVCTEALALSREAGDARGISIAASNLGHLLAVEGDIQRALDLQREAVVVTRALGDVQGTTEVLLDLAEIAAARGAPESAGKLLAAIVSLAESTGFALPPYLVERFQGAQEQVRRHANAVEFDRWVSAGRRMTLDDAVEFALASID